MGADLSVNNYSLTSQNWNALMNMYAQNPYMAYGLNSNQTSFKGGQTTDTLGVTTPATPEEKSSSGVGSAIGVIAVLGAATVLAVGAKRGGGIKHIGKGLKEIFTSTKDCVTGKNKLPKSQFTIESNSGKTVCTIPDRINRNGITDVKAAANELGITTNVSVLPEKAKLKSFAVQMDGKTLEVFNGKIKSVIDKKGNCITEEFLKPTKRKQKQSLAEAQKLVQDIINGKDTKTVLSDAKYVVSENGVTSLYKKLADDKYELEKFVTRKFNSESEVVKGYVLKNDAAKTALANYTKGEAAGLNILKAEYDAAGIGTFKIENNEILGIQVGGKYFTKDSYEFAALVDANKEVYEKVLKEPSKLKNAVFTL